MRSDEDVLLGGSIFFYCLVGKAVMRHGYMKLYCIVW